jgi:gamma-glutamyl:cysteine ligase YbdK (ATP-grasp superfamily)
VHPGAGARGAREVVLELVDRLADDADAVGAGWALERVAEIASRGSSAELQLARYRRGAGLDEILRSVIDETGTSA